MAVLFRWNEWNLEHVAEHGVSPEEAEWVVEHARPPYPERREEDKWRVAGRGRGRRWLQVVFIFDPEDTVYVVHARPLADREKQRERRKTR